MIRMALLTLTVTLAAVGHAAGQAIFVVRHAERADRAAAVRSEGAHGSAVQSGGAMMADDPDLSAAGRERAQSLAGLLREADIRAIYSSDLKRSQQTAAPLAAARHLTIQTVPANETRTLLERVKGSAGNVLIVGHSNTIPAILAGLGITQRVEIGETEYDNLFIVVSGDKPSLVRLRYR